MSEISTSRGQVNRTYQAPVMGEGRVSSSRVTSEVPISERTARPESQVNGTAAIEAKQGEARAENIFNMVKEDKNFEKTFENLARGAHLEEKTGPESVQKSQDLTSEKRTGFKAVLSDAKDLGDHNEKEPSKKPSQIPTIPKNLANDPEFGQIIVKEFHQAHERDENFDPAAVLIRSKEQYYQKEACNIMQGESFEEIKQESAYKEKVAEASYELGADATNRQIQERAMAKYLEARDSAEILEHTIDPEKNVDIHERVFQLEQQLEGQKVQMEALAGNMEKMQEHMVKMGELQAEIIQLMLQLMNEKDEEKKKGLAEKIFQMLTNLVGIMMQSIVDPDKAAAEAEGKIKHGVSENDEGEKSGTVVSLKEYLAARMLELEEMKKQYATTQTPSPFVHSKEAA